MLSTRCALATTLLSLSLAGQHPLLGPESTSANTGLERHPTCAFDPTSETYLIVWIDIGTPFSGSEVRARRTDASGNAIGAEITVAAGPSLGSISAPAVGRVGMSTFLVAWSESGASTNTVSCASVDAATGAVSSTVPVFVDPAVVVSAPDVSHAGGGPGGTDSVVVWDESAGIAGAKVSVVGNTPTVGPRVSLGSNPSATRPRISMGSSPSGERALVFDRIATGGSRNVLVRFLDADLTGTSSNMFVASNPSRNELAVDVDGDGSTFAILFAREEVAGTAPSDLYVRLFTQSGGTWSASTPVTPAIAEPGQHESLGSIAWLGTKILVTGARSPSGQPDIDLFGRTLDKFDASPCSDEFSIATDFSVLWQFSNARAIDCHSDYSAGGSTDRACMTYLPEATTASVVARWFEASQGGPIQIVGPGCGPGGNISATGPSAFGNRDFGVQVQGVGGSVATLSVGSPQTPFPCGACDILSGFAQIPLTLNGGAGTLPIPLQCDPSLDGVVVDMQWISLFNTQPDCPIVPSLSVSDRMRVEVGY